jgi:hypothetical protein
MSDVPMMGPGATGNSGFNAASMMLITAIGALAFIAMLVLGAYAPDLRSGRNGGAHALSNAAVGFSGVVRLAGATGRNPIIIRSEYQLKNEDLAVITPDHGAVDLSSILQWRGPRVTLLVLPKWKTVADVSKTGWVRVSGLLPAADPARTLYPATPFFIARERGDGRPLTTVPFGAPSALRFLAPAVVQTVSSNQLDPVITDSAGHIVLGKLKGHQLFILADPDLINNHAMGDERQARAAVTLLDYLNSSGAKSVLFDVTANGLGRSQSPLKLAFDPPFLAVTLTIFAAMLLAAWQALVRFGPVRRRGRAIAFGKAALVENSAGLIRLARRETRLGGAYADLVRQDAARLTAAPANLQGEALDTYLDRLTRGDAPPFSALAARLAAARDKSELVAAARALFSWKKDIIR